MIHPLGEVFSYKFLLKNNAGMPISSGSPMLYIKKGSTQEYWNGIAWQASLIYLSMLNEGDGIYSYDFTPSTEDSYEFFAKDFLFGPEDLFIIKASGGQVALIGSTFPIKKMLLDAGSPASEKSVFVEIQRNSDSLYYNDGSWQSESYLSAMTEDESEAGLYVFDFSYDQAEIFSINITEATLGVDDQVSLEFSDQIRETMFDPVSHVYNISSENIVGSDGNDARVKDDAGVPIEGVVIEAHNKENQSIYRTVTDSDGKWSIGVPGGTYVIIAKKDGYSSVSIERQVS